MEEPAAHRVPQEIIDIPPALSTVSLVSRSWLRSARIHLFSEVSFYRYYALERVNTGLEIIQTSPAIAACIRSVNLTGSSVDIDAKEFEFLSHLPNVRSLTLYAFAWRSLTAEVAVQKALNVMVSTLESLTFKDMLHNTVELPVFICACQNLKSLAFEAYNGWEDGATISSALEAPVFRDPAVLSSRRPICLKRLSFGYASVCLLSSRAFLEMLLTRAAFQLDLEEFNLTWERDWSNPLQESFFQAIGFSLKTITLSPSVPYNQDPSEIIRLLSKCTQLSSFTLHIIKRYGEGPPVRWFAPMLDTLARVSSTHLKEFVVKCRLCGADVEKNQYLPWAKLDDAFSNTSCFPVFRKLCVVISFSSRTFYSGGTESVYRFLEESMPTTLKAGLLEIR
ncbi:hypothetical protein BDZ89DRAFT_1067522 [Hymenopellis radicata]|nr:hypothetical protein BDZ89DRAFT_1067522 [Hymenopellis radicata]